jgi:hypothetical protein
MEHPFIGVMADISALIWSEALNKEPPAQK